MCRIVPSFRIVLAEEKAEWKPFPNALDKKERKEFDKMFDIPRLYILACANSVQLLPLHPIIISILFHHYKELKECTKEVEKILMMDCKVKVNSIMEVEKLQETQEEMKKKNI
jgi:hypothetical protein